MSFPFDPNGIEGLFDVGHYIRQQEIKWIKQLSDSLNLIEY